MRTDGVKVNDVILPPWAKSKSSLLPHIPAYAMTKNTCIYMYMYMYICVSVGLCTCTYTSTYFGVDTLGI